MLVKYLPVTLSIVCVLLGYSYDNIFFILSACLGLGTILFNAYKNIKSSNYALDYLAFLSLVSTVLIGQYAAAAVVTLMFFSGQLLEQIANNKALKRITGLVKNIPEYVSKLKGDNYVEVHINDLSIGDVVLLRAHEVIPTDGVLLSDFALVNRANITGESIPVNIQKGDSLMSGEVSLTSQIQISISKTAANSTYLQLVKQVQTSLQDKAPLVTFGQKLSTYFTGFVLLVCSMSYFISKDVNIIVSILVLATPCPLLIAGPVAFISGMSKAASLDAIVRKPSVFEALQKSSVICFDKTGTLTKGDPTVVNITYKTEVSDEKLTNSVLFQMESISMHPFAKAIISKIRHKELSTTDIDVQEKLGSGIAASIDGDDWKITSGQSHNTIGQVELLRNNQVAAVIQIEDSLKSGVMELMKSLKSQGKEVFVLTGDSQDHAENVLKGIDVKIFANLKPGDKSDFIASKIKEGKLVTMIGDGINDAPALASASSSIVFTSKAVSDVALLADVALTTNTLQSISNIFSLSQKVMVRARTSMSLGIGMSTLFIIIACFGYIEPLEGAIIQEGIDVIVILYALHTLSIKI